MNLYIFFLTASVVLVGILFFFCLQRFRKFNSYYELLSNVSFLQRIERGSFFFLLAFEKQKKKTDYYNRILLMNDLHWFQL